MSHLKDVGMSYFGHMSVALSYVGTALSIVVKGIIHSLFPDLFVNFAKEGIAKMVSNFIKHSK